MMRTKSSFNLLMSVATLGLVLLSGCEKAPEIKGKVLHLVLEDNVKTSDPTAVYDMISGEVVYQIYETPYQYDYYSETPKVIPMLAEAMPTVSKDGLTVTFKIRKGLRYQDDPCFKATGGKGREVKAQDFIFAWKRHADPANESQGFWIWEGKVVGIGEFQKKFETRPAAQVMAEDVEGFKALDDYTLQLKLLKPYPQLLYVLAMTFASPIPPEAVSFYGKDFTNHPVGTGPFRAQSYNPTSRIVLVKNENYRDDFFPTADKLGAKYKSLAAYAGKKLPLVDAIEFNVVKEEQPRWLGFLSGKYDQIKIPKDNFNSAIENRTQVKPEFAKKGIFVSIDPAISYWYVSFNMKDQVLGGQNKLLRQAIASAVDAEQWLQIFKNGRGSVQTEVNPPIVTDRCGKPYKWTYNIARAKELLAKAGYPDGKGLPVLKWDTRRPEMAERQLAEFIAKNLAAVGIKVEVIANTFPAYLDKSHKGNLQMSKGGFVMDYPDAENNFQMLYGPNAAPGPNEANFDNKQFNELFLKMAGMKSSPQRKALVCKMEAILEEELPWAFGIYEDEYRLAHSWLKNFHTAELIFTKWKYADIDDNEKSTTVAHR